MTIGRVGRESRSSSSRDLLIVMPTTKQWGKVEVGLGLGNIFGSGWYTYACTYTCTQALTHACTHLHMHALTHACTYRSKDVVHWNRVTSKTEHKT